MEVKRDVLRLVFRDHVTVLHSNNFGRIDRKVSGDVSDIINTMGKRSAKAQGLNHIITTARSFSASSNQRIFISRKGPNITGLLKTGIKNLFCLDRSGQMHEITPICVLDFYVHENCQRAGVGKQLFDVMLHTEGRQAHQLAYDRPSPKLLGFLSKYFGLRKFVQQNNNFVVFDEYFSDPALSGDRRSRNRLGSRRPSNIPAQLIAHDTSTPSRRKHAPRPRSSPSNRRGCEESIFESPHPLHSRHGSSLFSSHSSADDTAENPSRSKMDYPQQNHEDRPNRQHSEEKHIHGDRPRSRQNSFQHYQKIDIFGNRSAAYSSGYSANYSSGMRTAPGSAHSSPVQPRRSLGDGANYSHPRQAQFQSSTQNIRTHQQHGGQAHTESCYGMQHQHRSNPLPRSDSRTNIHDRSHGSLPPRHQPGVAGLSDAFAPGSSSHFNNGDQPQHDQNLRDKHLSRSDSRPSSRSNSGSHFRSNSLERGLSTTQINPITGQPYVSVQPNRPQDRHSNSKPHHLYQQQQQQQGQHSTFKPSIGAIAQRISDRQDSEIESLRTNLRNLERGLGTSNSRLPSISRMR